MLAPFAVADAIEMPIAVFGALLMLGALAAGVARRSFLSLTAAFVVAGFVLGNGGLEVLDLSARSGFVETLAVVALILILFRDGLEVEAELLQREWHLPFRKLVLAMPLTACSGRARRRTPSPTWAGPSRSCSGPSSRPPIRCSRPP